MRKLGKAWVQAAIDMLDKDKGRALAETAAKAGADWIEVGTPLLYYESIRIIQDIVASAEGRPVVVDYKAQDGVYKYFAKAAEYGAKYAVVLGVCNDGSIKEAVRAGKECGIKVMADLFSVKLEDLSTRAKELEALGVDAVYVHFGFDQSKYDKTRRPYDGVKEVYEAVEIPVGVGVFNLEEAKEGLSRGASWITVGAPVLTTPDDYEQFKKFVDAVHAFR